MREKIVFFILGMILGAVLGTAAAYYFFGYHNIDPIAPVRMHSRRNNVDLLPMHVMACSIYTTEIQEGFQNPHAAVFAIVHCEVHGGYRGYSDYKTEYPLQTPAETFAGYPIYTDGDTIGVKMTEHRPADLEGVKALATFHAEVVFIGFCREGTYRLNINGFEKTFRVGNIMPKARH